MKQNIVPFLVGICVTITILCAWGTYSLVAQVQYNTSAVNQIINFINNQKSNANSN
jgi:predicted negative regulator of RcsB-dependent stress response